VTADERYTALARQLWQQLQRPIEQLGDQELPLGALNGWGGYLYLVTHLAALWQDPHLLEQAEDYLPRIARLIPRDTTFDVIGGAAGCLLGLLALYRSSGSTSALALALACGEHLLAQAQPQVCGLAWSSAQFEHVPLAGFSHGAAGIALSLLQLSAASGDERFRAVAREALTYERGLFDQTKQNWPDLRPLSAGGHSEQQMLSWCHGAPGIGMARLAALPWLEEKEARAEIEAALATTLRRGFGQNHSLCHGDLGNLELFLSAAHLLREPAYGETAAKLAASILESIEQQGWCSGVPLGIEVPGLMTGLAGIGYGLLRCAAPEQTPALLLLASPPNNTPREDKR
jgi:type 2 lantibiotic biosynthesis protein LanM